MIDLDFGDFPRQDIGAKPLLVLHNDVSHYCAESKQWASLLCQIHPNSHKINYSEVFKSAGLRGLQNFILDFVKKNRIGIIYFDFIFDIEFDLLFVEELRRHVFVAAYFDDMALFFNNRFRYLAQVIDLALSHDYVEKYRFLLYGTKCLFFPMYDPDVVDYPAGGPDIDKKDIEVSFIGRMDRMGRKSLIERVAGENLGLELFGAGTQNGVVSAGQRIDIMQRSKIGLNFSGQAVDARHGHGIEKRIRQVKGRIWELAFSKALILTEDAPCLEKSFKIGKEVVVFEGEADLADKIRYFQNHDSLRKEIALGGFERAQRDCHPSRACEKLLQIIHAMSQEKKCQPAAICLDNEFVKSVSVKRVLCALQFMREKKYKLVWEELLLVFRSKRLGSWQVLRELWAIFLRRHPRIMLAYQKGRGLV